MNAQDIPARPRQLRRGILTGCDVVMALAAAVAIAALALEYGFYEPLPVSRRLLHVVEACVLATFVLDRILRLALSTRRRRFLVENWFDFALMAVAGAVAVAVWMEKLQFKLLSVAAAYVVITQIYILAVLVTRLVGFQIKVAGSGIHPIWVLIGSFAVVILFGTALLMLPRASPDPGRPVAFVDALFTATSGTCVTGLLVRDTATEYTAFGQTVILGLIQLGGLGIMVFGTVFALLAGRQLSIRESLLAGQVLANGSIGRIARMVKFAVVAALVVEAVAAVVMFPMWRAHAADASQAAFRSVFHAVSAFCNAGFSLQSDSLEGLRHHWQILGVMGPLIFFGGLGFPVLYDLARVTRDALRRLLGRGRAAAQGLCLHSKLVLSTSAILVIGGAIVLMVIEAASDPGQTYGAPITYQDNPYDLSRGVSLAELSPRQRARESLFQSITARTAGFNTVKMDRLSPAGKLWMCLLMMVGGSPASTAGGMKTVTVAVLVLAIWCLLRRREKVEAFRRSIAEPFIRKATTLAGLYLLLVLTVTLLLCVTMNGRRLGATGQEPTFMQLFFESCSACGTVGLSCGVTRSLTTFGKYVIIAAMFIGRLGPLTMLLAVTVRVRPARYAYPSEEVVLG